MAQRTPFDATIRAATRRLTVAQTELTAALADLVATGRFDKQMVTARLRLAAAELQAAKADLCGLQREEPEPT